MKPTLGLRHRRAASILCIGWVLTGTAWALDPHRHVTQFGHSAWRTQDGFISRSVAVAQTTDGFIWIATQGGLVRFDGVTFTPWSPPPGESLPASNFEALRGGRDGSLWIGTAAGLSRLKDGHLFNYTTTPRSPGISAIVEDGAGTVWVTRYRVNDGLGPLCRVAGERLICYGEKEGLLSRFALGLAAQSDGTLWFGCQKLCRLAAGEVTSHRDERVANPAGGVGVIGVAVDATGSVWATFDDLGPRAGVQHYADGKWSPYVVPGIDGSGVRSRTVFVDRQGALWIGTQSSGLYRVHDGHADHYDRSDGLSGNEINSIHEDREGNLWVATDRGLDMFRDTPVVTYSTIEGLAATDLHSVLPLRDGTVWVGSEEGLSVIDGKGIRAIEPPPGIRGKLVGGLLEDSAGRLWVGAGQTLMRYEGGRFSPISGVDGRPLARSGTTSAFAEDRSGDVWALTFARPDRYRLLRVADRRVVEDIPLDTIVKRANYLAADPQDGVWVAGIDGDLARVRNGKSDVLVRLATPEAPVTGYGLSVDSDGSVLFATTRGLYRWQHGNVSRLAEGNGLPCSSVYSAIRDDDAALWMHSRCGLLRLPAGQWAAWSKAPDSTVSPDIFDLHDGAQPTSGVLDHPSVGKSPDGRLWFATRAFVQMIDPRRTHVNTLPPPVHIEAVVADGNRYAATAPVRLPPRRRHVEIDYTALSYRFPRSVLFRYRLEGKDPDWQDAGVRRQALYNDLRPGRYRFRVIASNDAGVWNEEGASLEFTMEPAWFQTRSFLTACLLLALVSLSLLYRMRVAQVSRRMAHDFNLRLDERVHERTRIARELHDTLLQSFQGLMLRFQGARELLPAHPEQAVDALDGALDRADLALTEGRDAIQDLRAATTVSHDLAQAIASLAEELTTDPEQGAARFRVSVEGSPRELHPVVRDDIHRIACEALRNAYRHAQADQIEAEITYGARELLVRIRDDGRGIDAQHLKSGRARHWGLTSMRERAQRIGAELSLWSEMGAGTEVELRVPDSVAYEPSHRSGFVRRLRSGFTRKDSTDER